jgi:hypothetical protein
VHVDAAQFIEALRNTAQTNLTFEHYFSTDIIWTLESGGSFSWVAHDGGSRLLEATIRLEATGSGMFIFNRYDTQAFLNQLVLFSHLLYSDSSSPTVANTNDAHGASPSIALVLRAVLFSIFTLSISLAA